MIVSKSMLDFFETNVLPLEAPTIRYGQAFYNYFALYKVVNGKTVCDQIFEAKTKEDFLKLVEFDWNN